MEQTTFAGSVSGRCCRSVLRPTAAAPEDDIAVATIGWARGEGPPPYPLAQSCQGHAISLAIGECARAGRAVRVTKETWV